MIKRFLLLVLIFSLTMLIIGCVPRADLMVQSLDDIYNDCSLVAAPGSCAITLTFTIVNIGLGDAGPFNVLAKVDPGLAQQGTVSVVSLAAGATTTLTITLPPGGNCYDPDCAVEITVDSDNDVIESNEGNNIYIENIIG